MQDEAPIMVKRQVEEENIVSPCNEIYICEPYMLYSRCAEICQYLYLVNLYSLKIFSAEVIDDFMIS